MCAHGQNSLPVRSLTSLDVQPMEARHCERRGPACWVKMSKQSAMVLHSNGLTPPPASTDTIGMSGS